MSTTLIIIAIWLAFAALLSAWLVFGRYVKWSNLFSSIYRRAA